KPIFVPLYLVLLRVLLLEPDEPVRASFAAALRQWRVWALYVVPVALYSVVYVRGYVAGGQLHSPSLATVGPFLANSWFRVVAPGTFGLYIPQTNDSTSAILAFAGVQVLVVAGVVWTLVRRKSAWRAWLFLAVTVLANALAVGLTRIGIFGPRQVAYILAYNVEIVFLVVISVGAAVLGSRRAGRPPSAPHRTFGTPFGARALVATALASYLALSWWGSHRISQADVWPGPTARAYVAQVKAFVGDSERLGLRPVFVDGMVPEPVMFPAAGPWTSHSEVFPLLDEEVTFEVGGRELFEVTSDGSARPVNFVSDAGGAMAALLGLGVMDFDASKAEVRDGALCITSGKESEPVSMAVPIGAGGERPHVLLGHSSGRRQVAAFVAEPPGGGPLGPPRYIWLK
ncbi:MAG: LPXTG cell wall anchor domain-containing protein, partial [Acidimicrobiales bacterium]|nr:LPXTG cell wall anchor domain-containing protein [Acidimicrobiales bacterium]